MGTVQTISYIKSEPWPVLLSIQKQAFAERCFTIIFSFQWRQSGISCLIGGKVVGIVPWPDFLIIVKQEIIEMRKISTLRWNKWTSCWNQSVYNTLVSALLDTHRCLEKGAARDAIAEWGRYILNSLLTQKGYSFHLTSLAQKTDLTNKNFCFWEGNFGFS